MIGAPENKNFTCLFIKARGGMEHVDHVLVLSNMGLLALALMLMAFISSRVPPGAAGCPDTRPAVWWTVSAWRPAAAAPAAPASAWAQTTR